MTVVWTPPLHVQGGVGWPSSDIDEQIIDNLQFLHDGLALWCGTPTDLTQKVLPQSANRAFVCPFITSAAMIIPGLTYKSDTTSGNVDVGIYDDDGNGTTCSRLKSSGSTAMPGGATSHTINFSSPQSIEPFHKYWFAMAFSSTTARTWGTDGPYSLICKQMDTALPLPATITFAALSNGIAPCLIGLSS